MPDDLLQEYMLKREHDKIDALETAVGTVEGDDVATQLAAHASQLADIANDVEELQNTGVDTTARAELLEKVDKTDDIVTSGKNVRDDYAQLNKYVNYLGTLANNADSRCIRIPVVPGETWVIWYPDEAKFVMSTYGALRLEIADYSTLAFYNMALLPAVRAIPGQNVFGRVITIPDTCAYMCVNLKVLDLFDYRTSAVIAKGLYADQHITEIDGKRLYGHTPPQTHGRKWAALGDSITEYNATATNNYVKLTSDALGMPVRNLGKSGRGYKRNGGFLAYISDIPAGTELITIYGSGNDMNSYVLGAMDDVWEDALGTSNTLCAYISHTYDLIIAAFPLAKIAVITPVPWASTNPAVADSGMSLYVNAIKGICAKYAIPCLDLYRCSNLRPWQTEQNNAYFNEADGCHPNDAGHGIIANKIIEFLRGV